jgi:hypothetical protein
MSGAGVLRADDMQASVQVIGDLRNPSGIQAEVNWSRLAEIGIDSQDYGSRINFFYQLIRRKSCRTSTLLVKGGADWSCGTKRWGGLGGCGLYFGFRRYSKSAIQYTREFHKKRSPVKIYK